MMRKIILAVAAIGMGAMSFASVWADAPTTRPEASTRPSEMTMGRWGRTLSETFGMRAGRIAPPTQQEWDEMMAFMEINSPARWRVLSTIPLRPNGVIRRQAINRYRNYLFTVQHFPDIKDLLLERIHLEDDLFALTLDAQSSGDTEIASIRDKIHGKIAEIVQLDFAERQARIDKLEKLLEQDKNSLAADQASEEKLIDARTDQIMGRLDRLSKEMASPTTRPMTEETEENEGGNSDTPVVNLGNAATPPQK
jgi:hypothetical protein